MKVRTLIEALQKMDPEDHICALVYDKMMFDFDGDDEMVLTNEGWEKVCNEFDELPFSDIWESIHDAVLDHADETDGGGKEGQVNIFDKTPTYEDWCLANGLDPENDENYNSYSEWKANS